MDLRLSLAHLAGDHRVDVVVSGPPGRALADILPHLTSVVGAEPGAAAHVDGSQLSGAERLGWPPLLDGARLTWSPSGSDDAPSREDRGARPLRAGAPAGRSLEGGEAAELRVVSGPGAGRRWLLPLGRFRLGRGDAVDLRCDDPLISRRHAHLSVTTEGVRVVDLGSANGTVVVRPDGSRLVVSGLPVELPAGAELRLGGSVLVWGPPPDRGHGGRPTGDGTIAVNRAPRVLRRHDPALVRVPRSPEPLEPPHLSLVMVVLPLLVSCGAAWALGSPLYVAFGLLGPAMSLGVYLTERRRHAHRTRRLEADHARSRAAARRLLRQAMATEAASLYAAFPDLAVTARVATHRTPALWERNPADPDWLTLRLGRGSRPARATLLHPDGGSEQPLLRDVPVTIDLAGAGVVGLAPASGGFADVTARVDGMARALVAQLVTAHGPGHVRLWLIADEEARLHRWRGFALLPHVLDNVTGGARVGAVEGPSGARLLNDLLAHLDRAGAAGIEAAPREWHVVVWDGAGRLRLVPGMARILREGPALGIISLCVDRIARDLPAECRALVEVGPIHAEVTITDAAPSPLRPDLASDDVFDDLCHRLAPVRDTTPESNEPLPDVAPFEDPDLGRLTPDAIAARWSSRPADTSFILGADASGPAALDLVRDGPHVLIGGTTGSGKSELLRSMVAALALRNRPDRLSFVLIDYKGGSAFDACADLPHVVGVVTDLDDGATARALTGLEAELRRRERLLRSAEAADLAQYEAAVAGGARDADGHPLVPIARLVLVIDEFRALAEDLPEFLDGLVRIAALGRSLGLHLVLATQRPSGVVTADLRANVGLRIALRVRDPQDSWDIVDCATAADLDPRCPGRAVIRTAGGTPHLIQTAYLGPGQEPDAPDGADVVCRVRPVHLAALAPAELPEVARVRATPLGSGDETTTGASGRCAEATRPSDDPGGGPAATAQDVVAAITSAAQAVGSAPPPPPWLPPLPLRVTPRDLEGLTPLRPVSPEEPRAACEAPFGPRVLVDDPAAQCRRTWGWTPSDGHLAVVGSGGSGRTTTLAGFVEDILGASCPGRVHLYVVDAHGGLAPYRHAPHVAAYLTPDEGAAIQRLVAGLRDRVRRAASAMATAWSTGADMLPTRDVLIVDGWELLWSRLESMARASAVDDLIEVVRSGTGAGVSVLATGGRGLLAGSAASAFRERLVLRLTDPGDAFLAGVHQPGFGSWPPGRAVVPGGWIGHVLPSTWTHTPSRRGAAGLVGSGPDAWGHAACGRPDWIVRSLPLAVSAEEVRRLDASGADAAKRGCLVGLRADGAPAVLPSDGRGLLVAGPSGSGRTTALRTIAAELTRAGQPWVWCTPRRPVSGWAGTTGTATGTRPLYGPADDAALADVLRGTNPPACLVDDVDQLVGSPLEAVLAAHAAESPPRSPIVAAGRTAQLASVYRGLVGVLRTTATGVALHPDHRADELFGVALPDGEPRVPGRGALVVEGRATAVHVALSDLDRSEGAGRPPDTPGPNLGTEPVSIHETAPGSPTAMLGVASQGVRHLHSRASPRASPPGR